MNLQPSCVRKHISSNMLIGCIQSHDDVMFWSHRADSTA